MRRVAPSRRRLTVDELPKRHRVEGRGFGAVDEGFVVDDRGVEGCDELWSSLRGSC
jgi:hypothetical protein